jgi:hypothetical protein
LLIGWRRGFYRFKMDFKTGVAIAGAHGIVGIGDQVVFAGIFASRQSAKAVVEKGESDHHGNERLNYGKKSHFPDHCLPLGLSNRASSL